MNKYEEAYSKIESFILDNANDDEYNEFLNELVLFNELIEERRRLLDVVIILNSLFLEHKTQDTAL